MRIRRILLITFLVTVVIIATIGALGYGGFRYWQHRRAAEAQVRCTDVVRGDLLVELRELATLQPETLVEIKSKVPGRVEQLHYEAGALIASGSVLAELDREHYERQVEKASRDLQLAREKLQGLLPDGTVVTEPESLDPTTTEVLIDRLLIEYGAAKVDYESKQGMFAQDLIAMKTLDDAEKQYQRSFVAYHDAIRDASLALLTAEDAWEQAVEELSETTILAPVAGVLTKVLVDEGELVQGTGSMTQGTPLAELADLSAMVAVINLNEVDVSKITVGASVELVLDAKPDHPLKGRVDSVSPSGENKNNIVVFEVKIRLLEQADFLRPEMTANANILVDSASDVIKIPLESIRNEKDRKLVTILKPDPDHQSEPTPTPAEVDEATKTEPASTPEKTSRDFYATRFEKKAAFTEEERPIKVGLNNELWAEIISGVSVGEVLKLPDILLPELMQDF